MSGIIIQKINFPHAQFTELKNSIQLIHESRNLKQARMPVQCVDLLRKNAFYSLMGFFYNSEKENLFQGRGTFCPLVSKSFLMAGL